MAKEREGQTVEHFANHFEARDVEPNLAVAVHSIFQELILLTDKTRFPVCPADVINDYGIDAEVWEYEASELAKRLHFALPVGQQPAEFTPIVTVEDLVIFLAAYSKGKRLPTQQVDQNATSASQ